MSSGNTKLSENAQNQTLNNIQSLQKLEKELYQNLEKMSANNENKNLQIQIINKINDISQTRIALFEQLQSMYLMTKENVKEKESDLVDQLTLIGVVENELNNSKQRMNSLTDYNQNNIRLAEINTYYSNKYEFYYGLLKVIIIVCLVFLMIIYLVKREFISNTVATVLAIIGSIIGGIIILYKLIDINSRNNLVFDEYDISFDPNTAKMADSTSDISGNNQDDDAIDLIGDEDEEIEDGGLLGCKGANCCGSNLEFNEKKGLCEIPKAAAPSKTNGKKTSSHPQKSHK